MVTLLPPQVTAVAARADAQPAARALPSLKALLLHLGPLPKVQPAKSSPAPAAMAPSTATPGPTCRSAVPNIAGAKSSAVQPDRRRSSPDTRSTAAGTRLSATTVATPAPCVLARLPQHVRIKRFQHHLVWLLALCASKHAASTLRHPQDGRHSVQPSLNGIESHCRLLLSANCLVC